MFSLVFVGGLGCAGGLEGDTFYGRGFAFRIGSVPPGWQRVDVSHAALAFRDAAGDASVVVNARCGVDGEDVPLQALTQHLFLRFTEREIVDQRVLPFDRREAMRTVVTAKLDGVPMKFDVWVMKKDGCVYDLDYIAPPAHFDSGDRRFEAFVGAFATVAPRAN